MVDYLFGRSLVVDSAAPDADRRAVIGKLLRLILAQSGGIVFLQQLALIGSVHGFVDVLVKLNSATPVDAKTTTDVDQSCSNSTTTVAISNLGQPSALADSSPDAAHASTFPPDQSASGENDSPIESSAAKNTSHDDAQLARLAGMIRLEIVEPARALPVLNRDDWRVVDAYAQVYEIEKCETRRKPDRKSWLDKLRSLATAQPVSFFATSNKARVLELITPTQWFRYEEESLVASGKNSLGELPLVHVQNVALPFEYAGTSDVEILIPLQDELNTRLSDRANRITLQSFKMYLGKGIENFTSMPIAPGRMWQTDNESAEIITFGGDSSCPSEDAHIGEIREAMDKSSGVTPIAAGAIKGRIGRLTSAAALRVTLLALLAKTEKKRTTYGAAIEKMCELALLWLDRAGVFPTTPAERRIELSWPSPLPENQSEKLEEAQAKLRLGISQDVVLRELGY